MSVIETEATLTGNTYADGVTLLTFGEATHYMAAEVIAETENENNVVLRINEPADRLDQINWPIERERDFRDTVRKYVKNLLTAEADYGTYWLVFDPERDNTEEERIDVQDEIYF